MSFTDARKAITEQKADVPKCGWCGEPTEAATLSSFGARCGRCYAAYCNTPAPVRDPGAYASELLADIAKRQRGEA